jgi:hypothetical protein
MTSIFPLSVLNWRACYIASRAGFAKVIALAEL